MNKKTKKTHDEVADDPMFEQLADFFKMMGDATRLRLLYALSKEELCVQDLTIILNLETSAISHSLRSLKAARIVKPRREGKYVYYSLDDDHVTAILDMAITHILEN